jgi:NAD-dependent deacetylase
MYTKFKHVVALTSAGISAEFELSDVRRAFSMAQRDQLEELLSLKAWKETPKKVQAFQNQLRKRFARIKPGLVHSYLYDVEDDTTGSPTQFNVLTLTCDRLFEKANVKNVHYLNGRLDKTVCRHCGAEQSDVSDLTPELVCKSCQQPGGMLTDMVLLGEDKRLTPEVTEILNRCDYLMLIGVHDTPDTDFARDIARGVKANGGNVVEFELDVTPYRNEFDDSYSGNLAETVCAWRDKFLFQ